MYSLFKVGIVRFYSDIYMKPEHGLSMCITEQFISLIFDLKKYVNFVGDASSGNKLLIF